MTQSPHPQAGVQTRANHCEISANIHRSSNSAALSKGETSKELVRASQKNLHSEEMRGKKDSKNQFIIETQRLAGQLFLNSSPALNRQKQQKQFIPQYRYLSFLQLSSSMEKGIQNIRFFGELPWKGFVRGTTISALPSTRRRTQ